MTDREETERQQLQGLSKRTRNAQRRERNRFPQLAQTFSLPGLADSAAVAWQPEGSSAPLRVCVTARRNQTSLRDGVKGFAVENDASGSGVGPGSYGVRPRALYERGAGANAASPGVFDCLPMVMHVDFGRTDSAHAWQALTASKAELENQLGQRFRCLPIRLGSPETWTSKSCSGVQSRLSLLLFRLGGFVMLPGDPCRLRRRPVNNGYATPIELHFELHRTAPWFWRAQWEPRTGNEPYGLSPESRLANSPTQRSSSSQTRRTSVSSPRYGSGISRSFL